LAYVLAFALVVVTVGVFLRFHIAGTYQEEMAHWRAWEAGVADDRAHWISDWLTERQADAELISSYPLVRAALRGHYDAGQPSGRPAVRLPELTAVLDEMAGSCSYSGVYVLDREARVVAQSNHSTPLSPLLAETCRDAARTSGRRIVLLGDASDRSLLSFSVPVFPESDPTATGRFPAQPLGIALVVIDAARTIFPLVTREGFSTQTGETLLVRREGDEVIFFSPLRHIPAGSPNLRFPLSTAPLAARLAVEGLETFVECNDYWGAPALATTRYIPLTEWGIVQKINRAEALQDFYRMAIVEGLAAGLLIILLLGGLLLFHRRDVLTRVLKREEAKFRALLESAPDAMAIADGEGRVVLLNAQAETMFGFRRKELIGLGLRMLFPELAHVQPDESLPWDFSTEVAQQVGKTIEMRGLRKDGTKFPLEARLGRIETAEGPAFSCAIRDITERQRAEAEMAERHRLAALVAEVGVALTGAESLRRGLQQCAEILVRDINAAFARIWTVNEADKVLELQASAGMYTHLDGGHARVPMGHRLGHIAENGEPHLTNTVQQDSWVGDPQWARREGMVAFAGYPLKVGEHVLGVVVAFARKPLTPATLQAFASVARNIAQFIERKRAEEALRESEEKYRALIETTGTGYVIIDTQGRVVDANPEYVRLTSRRALQEILGHRIAEWTAQHDLARTAEAIRRCAELGFARNFEIEHVNGDGKCIPIEVNATVVLVAGAVRMVGLCRDITERKRAEQALRESEARYRRLFEQNLAGVFRGTVDGHVLDCNNAYARMLGYNSPQEILHLEKLDYFYDAQEGMAAVARLRGEGSHTNFEVRLKRRDGSPLSVLANVTLTEMGESRLPLVEGTLIDITMRQCAEEALRASEERYRELFENASDLVYTTDLEGRLTSLNRVAEQTIAYSREEAAQMNLRQLVDPRHWQRLEQSRERLLAGDSAVTLELEITAKDGRRVMLEVNPRLIYKDGKPAGMQGIGRDITGRDEKEMELRHAQKLESVGRLASGIAHEINTPIQFVGDNTRFVQDSFGGLQTLLSKYQELRDAAGSGTVSPDLLAAVRRVEEESDCAYLLEEIPKALAQTLDGATRVATLVRAMKDFAHPESKEKAAADLNKALLSTLTVARNELKCVADVETDLGDLPLVVCNISDLNQVFLNLLVNAAHAISEVVKGSGEKGKIRVRTVAEDNTVLVTIADTGCGIPEGIRTRVFDPFFTTKEVGRGTGQGLAIARSVVVERHKGTLTFESEVGKGTTFYICLPLEPGECSRETKVH
jgi:PAS domain S-box-containing protein